MAPPSSESEDNAPPVPITKWTPAFEAVLKQICVDYEGQDPKVRDGMATGMRRLFEKPFEVELGHLSACRGRTGTAPGPMSTEDAQRVIFFPQLADMQVYVDAFGLLTPEGTARREKLMKFKLLCIFYTLHRKDGALADRFMHCGGLESLCDMVGDDSDRADIIRSQAVELLMELLEPQMQLPVASSPRQAHLHHQIWRCLRSRAFWQNFARIIADPAERFPRSHENCTRIIAGAIGWMRPEERCIPEAVAPPDVSEAADAIRAYLGGSKGIRPDIRGIAEDLLEELTVGLKMKEDPLQGEALEDAREDLFEDEAVRRESSAHAWQALRRLGNDAFKKGLIWPAEAAYGLALQEGGTQLPDHEASLILSNRSLMLLKAGHPADAARSAAEALRRDPRNAKAAYRRAVGLEALASAEIAPGDGAAALRRGLRFAEEAFEAAELAARLEAKDAKVAELLQKAKGRLEELRQAEAASSPAEAEVAPQVDAADAAADDGAALDGMD